MVGFVGGLCATARHQSQRYVFHLGFGHRCLHVMSSLKGALQGLLDGWMVHGTVNHPISSSGNSDCQNRMFWAQGFFHEFSESQDLRCIEYHKIS